MARVAMVGFPPRQHECLLPAELGLGLGLALPTASARVSAARRVRVRVRVSPTHRVSTSVCCPPSGASEKAQRRPHTWLGLGSGLESGLGEALGLALESGSQR